jgi:hypothetical protein
MGSYPLVISSTTKKEQKEYSSFALQCRDTVVSTVLDKLCP